MSISELTSKMYRRRRAFMNDFDDPNVEAQYAPDLELEPIHLDIDLHVDVANKMAQGVVTTTVKARRGGVTVLKLDALDLEVTEVRDADGHELSWRYDDAQITIGWQTPFAAGEQRQVGVTYRVTEPVDGMYFSQPNEAYPNQAWYATTDHETERARHWLPCIDLPNVRTTLDIRLRAESRFTILANGYLVEEREEGDGTKTAHWKLEQLCPSYLICFAIGDFTRADDGAFNDGEKEIEVAYFCTPEHSAEDLLRTFGRSKEMMAWMTKKLAMPFPYPKYYQYALPGISGAMENISLVSWYDAFVQDETLGQEIEWLIDQINVHEMAHSYFGDAIVCRDFAHAWLKESWATYIEQCWREDAYNQDEALYVYYMHADSYFKEAENRYKRPIVTRRFKSSWQMYDVHLYEGGACRLHTLRCELGDEVFWAGVRDYLQRYNGKVVETDHFRHIMEEHSGRSLGRFFDQWFHTAGYPSLKVSFSYDDKQKQGTFEIEQTQVDKKAGIPAFVLSSEVSWTIEGQEHRLPIALKQAKQVITVAMSAEPQQVRFDPDCKALHKLSFNPGATMLRKQLTDAKDVIGRIQAGNELAKTNKRANINAIVDAYQKEPFWGVRREFAKALGDANSEAAIAGLAKVIAFEQEPMVLRFLLRAAGNYRDPRIRDAVASRVENGLPHLATQVAYETLGAQRRAAPWDLLKEGIEQESYNGFAQSGAFRGLAATRRPEAIDLLLEKVPYGATSNRARPAAVSALADIGKGQEKQTREQIVETLIDLLRDPWYRVRKFAAYGLRTMKAPQAIGALQSFARTLSHQDQVEIEKIIAALRKQDKSDGSALKKQVEELQEKVRKLEEQLQTVQAKMEPAQAQ
ncbi:MAG: M1 family aminopeptidase [Ardenticatenaceae bacterium]